MATHNLDLTKQIGSADKISLMTNFVHLTNKTEYSLSEGAITINRIAEL